MKNPPTIDTETCLGANFLQCPSCGGVYLHQHAPTVEAGSVTIPFDCEHCNAISALCIAQSKGNTHVNWVQSYQVPQWLRDVLKAIP